MKSVTDTIINLSHLLVVSAVIVFIISTLSQCSERTEKNRMECIKEKVDTDQCIKMFHN